MNLSCRTPDRIHYLQEGRGHEGRRTRGLGSAAEQTGRHDMSANRPWPLRRRLELAALLCYLALWGLTWPRWGAAWRDSKGSVMKTVSTFIVLILLLLSGVAVAEPFETNGVSECAQHYAKAARAYDVAPGKVIRFCHTAPWLDRTPGGRP